MVGTVHDATLFDAWSRAAGLVVLAVALVTGGLGTTVAAGSVDRFEPIDDATPGQRSARQLCTGDAGTNCVNATLETSPFHCRGTNLSTFRCNVTYWVNLTVTGTSTCGNASVNRSVELSVSACTSGPAPVAHATSGPVTVTYNGRNTSRTVNATAWVCLDETSVCKRWQHDPVLLPSWREWEPRVDGFPPIEEETSHVICLGNSVAIAATGDPGPGCAELQVWNYDDCSGRGDNYHCNAYVYLAVDSIGTRICGLTKNATHGKKALACTLQSNYQFSYVLLDEKHFEWWEIPSQGLSVEVEVEACAYAFHPGAQRYCHSYTHTYHVNPEGCATECGVNDALSRVPWADLPPGIHP